MSVEASAEATNLDIVTRSFAAFAAGDVAMLRGVFTPDARYRRPPGGELPAEFRGRDAIMDFFAGLARLSDGTFRAAPLEMAARGDRVFVLYAATAARRGKTLDTTLVQVFTLADGLVTDVVIFANDHPALTEFWA